MTTEKVKPQLPSKVYAVFKCSICGNDYETKVDFHVNYHPRYGTATLHIVVSESQKFCYECYNTLGVDGVVKKLKELRGEA